MPYSARRYKGKFKKQIALEAFEKLGSEATIQQVDAYFLKHYGIRHCERSMYCAAKRVAQGQPPLPPRRYRRNKDEQVVVANLADVVARVKQLAHELGGYAQLEELISVLK
jgi:hypothetical protein